MLVRLADTATLAATLPTPRCMEFKSPSGRQYRAHRYISITSLKKKSRWLIFDLRYQHEKRRLSMANRTAGHQAGRQGSPRMIDPFQREVRHDSLF